MEIFQQLAQYGALGLIALAAIYGVYAGGKAAWQIYLQQSTIINNQHTEMVAMSERHAKAIDDVRVQTSQALDNNTRVMQTISTQVTDMNNRLGVVESTLKAQK